MRDLDLKVSFNLFNRESRAIYNNSNTQEIITVINEYMNIFARVCVSK